MFGEVDMEAFGCLGVVTVRCPMRANHVDVVLHCVDLGNVEVCADLLLDKFLLACVKVIPCVFKPLEGAVCVSLKVGIVDEIKDSTGCLYNLRVSCVSDDTKKHLLHVLVLVSSPLRDEGDPFLEMLKAWVSCHCSKTGVNLVGPTNKGVGDPFDKVIFENTLVELMEDIGGKG